MRASRHHCELRRKGDAFEVQDLGSGNGTLVNDKPATRKTLDPGDVVVVGKTSIIFSLGAGPTGGQPAASVPPPEPAPGLPGPPAPLPGPAPGAVPPGPSDMVSAVYERPDAPPDNAGATAIVFVVLGGVAFRCQPMA